MISALPFEWSLAILVTLSDLIWMSASGFQASCLIPQFALIAALSVCFLCNFYTINQNISERYLKLIDFVEFLILSQITSHAFVVLSYLVATTSHPLNDTQLTAIDISLGFHWVEWNNLVSKNFFHGILSLAYRSLACQIIGFIALYSYYGNKKRLREYFWISYICVAFTIFIFFFAPALGPTGAVGTANDYILYFTTTLKDLRLLKSSPFDQSLTGIIQFPSLHTSLGLINCYAFRKAGMLFYFIVGLNVLMFLSIPSEGGHYVIDMLAGAGVAIFAISLGHQLSDFLHGPQSAQQTN